MMMNKKRLLVAVDFSLPSIQALETAISLCEQLNGTLHIVYIADMGDKKLSAAEVEENSSIEARVLKDFIHQLEALVERMSNGKTEFTTEVGYGDPTAGILRAAAKVNADIMIMGTHGRTGIEHLLVGSVAESVLRKATIPLICVRAKDNATT